MVYKSLIDVKRNDTLDELAALSQAHELGSR